MELMKYIRNLVGLDIVYFPRYRILSIK